MPLALGKALKRFKRQAAAGKLRQAPAIVRNLFTKPNEAVRPYLARMGFEAPSGIRERVMQAAVCHALAR
jgi:hypothetical protein